MMKAPINPENIKNYFSEKLEAHGATPRGADWNSVGSQTLRFEQLIKVCNPSQPFSINDYGCGYGALIDFLDSRRYTYQYTGYDLLEPMVEKAREIYQDKPNCRFTSQEADLPEADYTVASGIFNIRFHHPYEEWLAYSLEILETMNRISQRGFSFNMLTSYSDKEYMRADLFYADPCTIFDYCKRHFSRNVALLHDYDLYDFTILVRKQG